MSEPISSSPDSPGNPQQNLLTALDEKKDLPALLPSPLPRPELPRTAQDWSKSKEDRGQDESSQKSESAPPEQEFTVPPPHASARAQAPGQVTPLTSLPEAPTSDSAGCSYRTAQLKPRPSHSSHSSRRLRSDTSSEPSIYHNCLEYHRSRSINQPAHRTRTDDDHAAPHELRQSQDRSRRSTDHRPPSRVSTLDIPPPAPGPARTPSWKITKKKYSNSPIHPQSPYPSPPPLRPHFIRSRQTDSAINPAPPASTYRPSVDGCLSPVPESGMSSMSRLSMLNSNPFTRRELVLALLVPPMGIYYCYGEFSRRFWLCVVLTVVGYFPGMAYSFAHTLHVRHSGDRIQYELNTARRRREREEQRHAALLQANGPYPSLHRPHKDDPRQPVPAQFVYM